MIFQRYIFLHKICIISRIAEPDLKGKIDKESYNAGRDVQNYTGGHQKNQIVENYLVKLSPPPANCKIIFQIALRDPYRLFDFGISNSIGIIELLRNIDSLCILRRCDKIIKCSRVLDLSR